MQNGSAPQLSAAETPEAEIPEAESPEYERLSGRKWKIPPVPVAADDCVVYVGRLYGELADDEGNPILDENGKPKRGIVVSGTPYQPHVGETIWLNPLQNMSVYLEFVALNRAHAESVGAPDSGDRQQKALRLLAEKLAQHVVAWNWTDNGGDPLPQPYKNPDALMDLDNAEFLWIIDVVQSGPPVERKNGPAPSPNTSSATGQRPRKPSSAGSVAPTATASPA